MATPDLLPVGGYANVTEVISANGQAAVIAEIDKLLALIPDTSHPTAQNSPPSGVAPLFDKIAPEVADALRVEIAALKTAIDAAPTA